MQELFWEKKSERQRARALTGFLSVGLGGAAGAMMRYAIGMIPVKSEFPVITLVINIIGAVLIGFIAGIADTKGMSKGTLLFLKTGMCGGFTTFSTFSLEAYSLMEKGKHLYAGSYAALSVILCLLGIYIGKCLSRCI